MLPLVPLDRRGRLGRDRDHGCAEAGESLMVVAQLREVPAAERSGEAAEEHEDDGSARHHVGEGDGGPGGVGEYEVRRRGADGCGRAVRCDAPTLGLVSSLVR
jgi:hypothetical protein